MVNADSNFKNWHYKNEVFFIYVSIIKDSQALVSVNKTKRKMLNGKPKGEFTWFSRSRVVSRSNAFVPRNDCPIFLHFGNFTLSQPKCFPINSFNGFQYTKRPHKELGIILRFKSWKRLVALLEMGLISNRKWLIWKLEWVQSYQ